MGFRSPGAGAFGSVITRLSARLRARLVAADGEACVDQALMMITVTDADAVVGLRSPKFAGPGACPQI